LALTAESRLTAFAENANNPASLRGP